MGRPAKYTADVEHLGGANFLVLLSSPGQPTYGVIVSRVARTTYARPMKPGRRYPASAATAVPPVMSDRSILGLARYYAAPYLEGLRRFA